MTRPEPAGAGTAEMTPEALAEAIVRLNDEDWETFDGGTEFRGVEEWPVAARDLLTAIAEIIRQERSAITAAESRAMERCAKIAENEPARFKSGYGYSEGRGDAANEIARAIRSSINPPGDT